MIKIFRLVFLISTFYLPLLAKTPTESLGNFKILVLTERGGGHEGFVVAALNWLENFAKEERLDIKVINHPEEVENEKLANYSVFIQLNYPPYNWTENTMVAFEKYIDEGEGAWIGFHHATLLGEFDGYPLWSWFSDFMGGIRFKSYIPQTTAGKVHVENTRHPVMKGLPASFVLPNDEWYTFDKNPRTNVQVLAHVDEASYELTTNVKMGDHPVIWVNPKKKAKNVYFLMGHHADLFKTAEFRQMFRNAILWATDGK